MCSGVSDEPRQLSTIKTSLSISFSIMSKHIGQALYSASQSGISRRFVTCLFTHPLIMTVKYQIGCTNIAVNKGAIINDFFVLSACLAGEVL